MSDLDFKNLDDIADAAIDGVLSEGDLPTFYLNSFGPMFELLQLQAQHDAKHKLGKSWINGQTASDLLRNVDGEVPQWSASGPRKIGFIRVNYARDNLDDWTGFTMKAKRAAVASGLTGDLAGQVVSALDELLDNVVEHSGAPRTGIAAYSEGDGVFEISISDSGMGVLKSLRRSNEYAHLDDHGDALKLFIKDRVSRFGSESGRGFGFRPIFTGLANAQCTIRFRSGDHALQIDGTRLCEAPATLLQSVNMDGLVCTIVCHHRNAN